MQVITITETKKFFDEIRIDNKYLSLLTENTILDSLSSSDHHIYS